MKPAASPAKRYRRRRALLATLAAATALVGAEQAVSAAPAGAVMQEGYECSIWIFLDCEEPNGGGGGGGSGAGGGSGPATGSGGSADGTAGVADGGNEAPSAAEDVQSALERDLEMWRERITSATHDHEGVYGINCSRLSQLAVEATRLPDASEIVGDAIDDFQACAQAQLEDATSHCDAQYKSLTAAASADRIDGIGLTLATDDYHVCSAKSALIEVSKICNSAGEGYDLVGCHNLEEKRWAKLFWASKERNRDRARARVLRRRQAAATGGGD